jgi:hypothetical protein
MKTIVEMIRRVISTSLLRRWAMAAQHGVKRIKQASRDFSLLACALETRDRH